MFTLQQMKMTKVSNSVYGETLFFLRHIHDKLAKMHILALSSLSVTKMFDFHKM